MRRQRPHITGLSHIALYAHDLEKSRAFYRDFLGFDEPYSLTNKDGSIHLTWIKINDRQTIELFPEKECARHRPARTTSHLKRTMPKPCDCI